MSSYYPRLGMAAQLPLTPPDSGSKYGYSNMHYSQPDPYCNHHNLSQTHHDATYDYQQSFMQPPVAPAPPTYSYPQSAYHQNNSLPPISTYYDSVSAPVLPPIHTHDRIAYGDEYQHRPGKLQHDAVLREQQQQQQQQRQAPKEEKATGGVSAKLDYEMDRMTDFVTEAAQSIFHHSMQNQPSFRKWVHQVLSATRLPSATILLSLHYLSHRVTELPETVPAGENQIYRLLAVSLILGSKFLDDNTFVNRSWSDVTAIKVSELNALEIEWLHLINYELHVDPSVPNGIEAWFNAWRTYDAKCAAKYTHKPPSLRVSPPTVKIQRNGSTGYRPYSPYLTPQSSTSQHGFEVPPIVQAPQFEAPPQYPNDNWGSSQRQVIEDFYRQQHRFPSLKEMDESSRRVSEERARQSIYAYHLNPHSQSSYYQLPPVCASHWDQPGAWNGAHGYDCSCSTCAYQRHYRPYGMAPSYATQTVMG